MHQSFRRILFGTLVFSLTIIIAVAGYMMAGWSLLDAVYMVVITVFGVGYGEVRPIVSPALRVFTILVIVAGTSSAVYIVGGFIQMVTEGEINRALDARRMMREIETLQQHVVICGFGRMGQILSRQMRETGQSFVVIDNNVDRIAEAETLGYLVLTGDATDEVVLETAGIRRAKVLATVLSEDALNVFITLTARGLNPSLVILARGEFPSTEKKLKQAGADHVVLPAAIGALRMAHMITHPAALDLLDPNDGRSNLNELLAQIDVQIDELAIAKGSPLIGGIISDLEIQGKGTFIVVALRRADGRNIIHPEHQTPLLEGDTVIVMGHRGDIPRFAEYYRLRRQTRYRGVKF
ncbi:potassium channel protein [Oscillatoria sp. FACHB-1407]|uniref:potassium channel family protein n=1 Tax=Oscillatoria sp. FACHB-1407 TaxID=2692847 RepID=UPI00168546EA|nr:potassium channel protein [Oscillatoria sp. FACHB-1407]MBD2465454.1 potassium channel protein [Oscillatoria sp. FACHB-1407]